MARVSDLQKIGILKREDYANEIVTGPSWSKLPTKEEYEKRYNKENQYGPGHINAINDGNKGKGKGVPDGWHYDVNHIEREKKVYQGSGPAEVESVFKQQIPVMQGGDQTDVKVRNEMLVDNTYVPEYENESGDNYLNPIFWQKRNRKEAPVEDYHLPKFSSVEHRNVIIDTVSTSNGGSYSVDEEIRDRSKYRMKYTKENSYDSIMENLANGSIKNITF